MSMVANYPGYVNILSEFLLRLYRFNVAANRMKRKLVTSTSETVFQTSHPDVDSYEEHLAWKRLYRIIGALDDGVTPAAETRAHDLDPSLEENAHLRVYHPTLPEDSE